MKQLGFRISCDHRIFKITYPGNDFKLAEKKFNETLGSHQHGEKGDVCKATKIDRISKREGAYSRKRRGWDLLLHNFI